MPIDRDVKLYLRDRIDAVKNYPDLDHLFPVPASVRRAKSTVRKFERKVVSAERRMAKRIKAARSKALNMLHFGTEKQARAAVEKLEAIK